MTCVTLTAHLTPASDEPRRCSVSQILQSRQTDNRLIGDDTRHRLSQKLRLSSGQMPRCRVAPPRIGAVLATPSAWHGVSGIPNDGSTGAGFGCLSGFHPRKFLCKDQESLFFHSICPIKRHVTIPPNLPSRDERHAEATIQTCNQSAVRARANTETKIPNNTPRPP